jgi:hypothetical protein
LLRVDRRGASTSSESPSSSSSEGVAVTFFIGRLGDPPVTARPVRRRRRMKVSQGCQKKGELKVGTHRPSRPCASAPFRPRPPTALPWTERSTWTGILRQTRWSYGQHQGEPQIDAPVPAVERNGAGGGAAPAKRGSRRTSRAAGRRVVDEGRRGPLAISGISRSVVCSDRGGITGAG